MSELTIATFISNTEKYNNNFFDFCTLLGKKINIDIIIFTDKKLNIKNNNVRQIIQKNTTKYKRIIELIKICNSENILCIDNDITIYFNELKKFVNDFILGDSDLAWGKIKAKHTQGLIPNLIRIDKNLSHDYIRPFLWKMNIGVSIPGQIFIMKKKNFINNLPDKDTVYDDLTLGMIARKCNLKVYYSKSTLGEELPKENFTNLIIQRKRWAKGFAQSIETSKNIGMLKFVIIHGFMYHLLWIVYYLILILIGMKSKEISIIFFLLVGIFLAEFSLKDFFYAILYMIIFPLVHVIWGIEFNKNIFNMKGQFNKIQN